MPAFDADARREFMLAAMRRAVAQLRANALEIEEVGVALGRGMIDAEGAASWLHSVGALGFIEIPQIAGAIQIADQK